MLRSIGRVMLVAGGLHTCTTHADPGDTAPCPMSPSIHEIPIIEGRMAIGLYNPPANRSGIDIRVPITFHVIRRSDGTGGPIESQIELALASANTLWSESGIQFCKPGATIEHLSDELYNNTDTLSEVNELRSMDQVPDTINVYFVNNLRIEIGSLCGISSFTTSAVQGIAVDNGCLPHTGNPSTFAHELAHYFDLYHTHEPAFGDECTDGLNCDIAGDLVCDTPADPNVRGDVSPGDCVWNGNDQPDCGEGPYTPPVRNVMSYSPSTCRDELTPMQTGRALATLINLRPELVANACDPCPNIADVNGDNALTPADFTAWIDAFNTQSPSADQNGDGVITPTDFTAWITNFNAGCLG